MPRSLSIDEIRFILTGPDWGAPPWRGDPAWKLVRPELLANLEEKGFLKRDGQIRTKPFKVLREIWKESGLLFDDEIVLALGSGVFGAAYLLTDGSVLKFSDSQAERECIVSLVRYGTQSAHLPKIFEYDDVANPYSEWFYYVREALDDIPDLSWWNKHPGDWEKTIHSLLKYMEFQHGLRLHDTGPQNWEFVPVAILMC